MIKQWTPKPDAPNADQLRHAIDSGRNKIDFPDPAAAPLGTDSEAANNPPSAGELQTSMQRELQQPRTSERQWTSASIFYIGFVLLVAAFGITVTIIG